jgi:DNA-binding Lrp family transcriptional regulator
LDGLDLRILKALLVNNGTPPGTPVLRKSFRSMAKDLEVDQGTIRSRIKKFQEQRVLRGWYLGVSPSLTGQDVVHAWLVVEPESDKDIVMERLLSVQDVERVCDYLGPKLSLVLLCKKGTDPDVLLGSLGPLVGSKSLHKQAVIQVPTHELKETDAAIIGVLGRDPWKPYSIVARELGLSAKTVKRRVAKLTDDGAVYILPIIDLKALQGIIPMDLVVDYVSRESRAKVNELITSHVEQNLVFSNCAGHHGYFALAVPNVSQVEQIARWVRQQNGVKEVHSAAIQDVVLNRKYYERWHMLVNSEREREPAMGSGTQIESR